MNGEFLKQCRINKNLSQQKVAGVLGYTPQQISSFESNRIEPSLECWSKYASLLGIDLDGFLNDVNKKNNDYCQTITFNPDIFAKLLLKKRNEKKLSQKKVSKIVKVNNKTVLSWEKAKSFPNFEQFKKLCELYNLNYNGLYFSLKNEVLVKAPILTKSRMSAISAFSLISIISVSVVTVGIAATATTARLYEGNNGVDTTSISNNESDVSTTSSSEDISIDNSSSSTTTDQSSTQSTTSSSEDISIDNSSSSTTTDQSSTQSTTYAPITQPNQCVVTWIDTQGETLRKETYSVGQYVKTYDYVNVPSWNDDEYAYIFDGWDVATPFQASEDITITAKLKTIPIDDFLDFELLSNDTYQINGIKNYDSSLRTQYHLNVPETYNSKPVTSIGDHAFENQRQLREINFTENITYVGSYAFTGVAMQHIKFPDSLTVINDYVCYAMCSYIDMTIGKNVTKIGKDIFAMPPEGEGNAYYRYGYISLYFPNTKAMFEAIDKDEYYSRTNVNKIKLYVYCTDQSFIVYPNNY